MNLNEAARQFLLPENKRSRKKLDKKGIIDMADKINDEFPGLRTGKINIDSAFEQFFWNDAAEEHAVKKAYIKKYAKGSMFL